MLRSMRLRPHLLFIIAARLWTLMAGGLEHFCPVRGLVQFVSSVLSLRGRCCFELPYGTVVVVVVFFFFRGEGGGTPVTSVQFPAQLRDFHNKKAIASPKQSHGAI